MDKAERNPICCSNETAYHDKALATSHAHLITSEVFKCVRCNTKIARPIKWMPLPAPTTIRVTVRR